LVIGALLLSLIMKSQYIHVEVICNMTMCDMDNMDKEVWSVSENLKLAEHTE
jgi:hypothetical protein